MANKKIVSTAAALALCLTTAAAPAQSSFSSADISAYAVTYDTDTSARYAEEVVRLVNAERAANGLAPLKMSDELCDAANVRAKEIQKAFSHTRPNGTNCFTALKDKGISYTYAAENIAYGQKTPEAVMKSWMNSSGHKANILCSKCEYIGVGVAYKNGTYYWTQFFASGKGMNGKTVTSAAANSAQTQKVSQKPNKQSTSTKTTVCSNRKCSAGKKSYNDVITSLLKRLSCKK